MIKKQFLISNIEFVEFDKCLIFTSEDAGGDSSHETECDPFEDPDCE